jgi:hypothetical protein
LPPVFFVFATRFTPADFSSLIGSAARRWIMAPLLFPQQVLGSGAVFCSTGSCGAADFLLECFDPFPIFLSCALASRFPQGAGSAFRAVRSGLGFKSLIFSAPVL